MLEKEERDCWEANGRAEEMAVVVVVELETAVVHALPIHRSH